MSKPSTSSKKTTPAQQEGSALPSRGGYQLKKGESYMNGQQLTYFKDMLMALKRSLASDIGEMVQVMQDEVTLFADPNDRATQESSMALELRNRDRERKLVKKVNEALGRIEDKSYGYCDLCGVEIGLQRLEVRPTATLCIDCKTMDEIREKQNSA